MDFRSLNSNSVKDLFNGIWNDFLKELQKIKDINADNTKSAFNKYFVEYLKKEYFKFNGRISRRRFWMFMLFSVLISCFLGLILPILAQVFWLAVLLPSIGLIIRRLQDFNLSGWFFFICIIPYIGGFILLVLLTFPSDKKANDFGAVDK